MDGKAFIVFVGWLISKLFRGIAIILSLMKGVCFMCDTCRVLDWNNILWLPIFWELLTHNKAGIFLRWNGILVFSDQFCDGNYYLFLYKMEIFEISTDHQDCLISISLSFKHNLCSYFIICMLFSSSIFILYSVDFIWAQKFQEFRI